MIVELSGGIGLGARNTTSNGWLDFGEARRRTVIEEAARRPESLGKLSALHVTAKEIRGPKERRERPRNSKSAGYLV